MAAGNCSAANSNFSVGPAQMIQIRIASSQDPTTDFLMHIISKQSTQTLPRNFFGSPHIVS